MNSEWGTLALARSLVCLNLRAVTRWIEEADRIDRGGLSGAKFGPLSGHMTMTARFREKLEWPEKLSTRGGSIPTFAPRIGFGDDRDGD